jgi:serine protease Do
MIRSLFPSFCRIALAGALATGLLLQGAAEGSAARGPESVADTAAAVIDAVVNISAATTVDDQRGVQMPQLPPGSPFQEFFDEFFGQQGPNGRNGQGPRQQRRSSSLGSGFVIDPAGIVITNQHVIGDANEITVIFTDGKRLKAEVVGKDAKVDIAVLRVKPDKPLKAVKFGDSEKMRIGDWVIAIGNPFGLGGSVSAGIVSARNRDISDQSYGQYLQTDAAINKGNSGGPLFNLAGEVVGINTAILSPTGGSIGIGFAVPTTIARPVIDQLLQFGETRRGWLGVRIQNVDDSIAESLGLGTPRGALVAGVDDKGPAKPAGIEPGDVIVKFDGRDVKESRDLPRLVGQTPVGKEVEVVVMRKGKEVLRTVKLGRLEETQQAKAEPGQPGSRGGSATARALGLELSPLNDDLRKRFSIKEGTKGVVVMRVDPNSSASDKRIVPGDVIVEVQQEPVTSPEAITRRIDQLKKDGRKSALLLVANAQGDVRFVALNIE